MQAQRNAPEFLGGIGSDARNHREEEADSVLSLEKPAREAGDNERGAIPASSCAHRYLYTI